MKKYINIITLATLALLAATSCQKELTDGNEGSRINSDEIGFSINQSNYWNNNGSGSQTKAGGDLTLFSADGDSLTLSLTISDNIGIESLPDPMSETKGVMITGTTLKDYNIGVNAFLHGTTSKYIDDLLKYGDNSHAYAPEGYTTSNHWIPVDGHTYYWPKASSLDFWAWAPYKTIYDAINTETAGDAVKISNFTVNNETGAITFGYDLGETIATAQPDLMFANVNDLSKDNITSQTSHDTGCVPLAFQHALSAVQFKVLSTQGAKVNWIKLVDVAKAGDCTFLGNAFNWDLGATVQKGEFAYNFNSDLIENSSSTSPYKYESGDYYASDRFPTANFMMIPQKLGNGQTISISVTLADDSLPEIFTATIPTTATLSAWEAGKTYVYTIKIDDVVSVEVTDSMTATTKSNISTKNTGTATAYLRAAVTAAWLSEDGMVVAPYSGAFPTLGTGWILGADGYYYYTYPVLGGNATANSLFASFTSPDQGPLPDTHLEMQILLQGVKFDAGKERVKDAWGETIPDTTGANIITSLSTTPETPTN